MHTATHTHCNTHCITVYKGLCIRASPSSAPCMSINFPASTHIATHAATKSAKHTHCNLLCNATYEQITVAVPRRHQRHFACLSICSRVHTATATATHTATTIETPMATQRTNIYL